jgi:hypothetical protein
MLIELGKIYKTTIEEKNKQGKISERGLYFSVGRNQFEKEEIALSFSMEEYIDKFKNTDDFLVYAKKRGLKEILDKKELFMAKMLLKSFWKINNEETLKKGV